jgi:signal transduction histidine kinase
MADPARKAHFAARMDLGAAALALPASAALLLALARGHSVVTGEGAISFLVLAGTGAAGLVCAALASVRERRQRDAGVPHEVDALLRGLSTALGDAAVAFDEAGRLVWANDAAVALAGCSPEAMARRGRDVLGEDLAVLTRGLARGPATGRVAVATPAGRIPGRAAAIRVELPSPIDVAAVRVEPPAPAMAPAAAAPPPPEPALAVEEVEEADIVRVEPPREGPPAAVAAPDRRSLDARLAIPALEAEVGAPLARASAAASLLRLALGPGNTAAEAQLARLQDALVRAEKHLALLAAAPEVAAPPAAVDLDAVVSEALAGVPFAPGVRVRRASAPAFALADPVQLRLAVRHVLRAAAAAMPAGGELGLRAFVRDGRAALEIADTGAVCAGAMDLALAERILVASGGRLERVAVPGRGALCRMSLPAALGARRAG